VLHEFIRTHRDQIISRCKERVSARPRSSQPTERQIDYGVPLFLDQLIVTLKSPAQASLEIGARQNDLRGVLRISCEGGVGRQQARRID